MENRVFDKDPNCVTRTIGCETVIVPVRGCAADLRAIYSLNESAAEIWLRLDGRRNDRELSEHLASIYEITASEALADVNALLETLSSAGLVRLMGHDVPSRSD